MIPDSLKKHLPKNFDVEKIIPKTKRKLIVLSPWGFEYDPYPRNNSLGIKFKPRSTRLQSAHEMQCRVFEKVLKLLCESSNTDFIWAGIEEFNIHCRDSSIRDIVVKNETWFKEFLIKICANRNLSVTMLSGVDTTSPDKSFLNSLNKTVDEKYIKIIGIPYIWFYIAISIHFSHLNINIDKLIKFPKTNLFVSMIRRGKYFRCYGIDMLAKYNLINDKSMLNICLGGPFADYSYKYWTPKKLTFKEHLGDYSLKMDNFPNDEYMSSFIELVFETTVDIKDISEKTVRPILFMKPFLLIGHATIHARLKEYGFELFEELFDYSFDSIENTEERIEKTILELKKYENLEPSDYDELYKKLLPKLKHNFNRLLTFEKYYPLPNEVYKVPSYVYYMQERFIFIKRHNHLLKDLAN